MLASTAFSRAADVPWSEIHPRVVPPLEPFTEIPMLAAFGDSMTARDSSVAANGINFNNHGFENWLRVRSRQRIDFKSANNFGVSGNTTAQMVARLPNVAASGAPLIRFLGGTNDANSGVEVSVTFANYQKIFDTLRELPTTKLILVYAVPPRSTWQDTSLAVPGAAKILQYNAWLADYCARNSKMLFVPGTYTAWDDGAGNPKPGYTEDGVHQTSQGAFHLSVPVLDTLDSKALLPFAGWLDARDPLVLFDGSAAPEGNKFTNPGLTGTGGTRGTGVTGTVADGWSVSTSIASGQTGTVAASIEGTGTVRKQVIDFASRAGVSESIVMSQTILASTGKYAVGEKVRMAVAYEASGLVNVAGINLRHSDDPGTGGTGGYVNFDTRDMSAFNTGVDGALPNHTGVLLTEPRVIGPQNTGGTNIRQNANFYVTLASANSGGASGTVKFLRPMFIRVP